MRVALTFDAEHADRPTSAEDGLRLVGALEAAGVTATFFVQGRWAETYPATVARIAAGGHLIGSHSHYHARMTLLTDAGIEADVRDAEAVIRAATGIDPRPWFRCPFGDGADDPRVLGRLAALGYRDIGWDVSPDDWQPDWMPDELVRRVLAGVRAHGDGAIVLLHTWPEPTWQALPALVDGLRLAGSSLVRVDELLPGTIDALAPGSAVR